MESYQAILSIRTRSESNIHGHWRAHAARAKKQRSATYDALEKVPFKKDDFGHAVVTLTRVSPRQLDSDNLLGALKAIRDGVTDWMSGGLNLSNRIDGINDRDPRIHWHYRQEKGKPKEYAVIIDLRWEEGMTVFVDKKYAHLDPSIAISVEAFMCLRCYQVTKSLEGTVGASCDGCGGEFTGVLEKLSNGNPRIFEKPDSAHVREKPTFDCSSD